MNAIGIDIIEISRIETAIDRWGSRFLTRIYSEAELTLCRGRIDSLAARFSAKEAVIKLISAPGIYPRDIEILAEPSGKPVVKLSERAMKTAGKKGITTINISLSHNRDSAIAAAIG